MRSRSRFDWRSKEVEGDAVEGVEVEVAEEVECFESSEVYLDGSRAREAAD